MKKIIIILILLIPTITYSQVYVRSAETVYFDEGWVNLAEYFGGTIKDGSDITDELQAAIDTKNNVIIPFTFATSICNFYISRNIRMANGSQIIQGAGRGKVFLVPYDNADTMFVISSSQNVLRDIGFKCVKAIYEPLIAVFIGDGNNQNVLENINFEGFKKTDADTGIAVKIYLGLWTNLYNCRFYNCEVGLYGERANVLNLYSCEFGANTITGLYLKYGYYISMFGGSNESGSEKMESLFILNDCQGFNMYNVYTEPAVTDIKIYGTCYLHIFGGKIGIINCDYEDDPVHNQLYLSLIDTRLEFPDSSVYPDVPIIYTDSLHHLSSSVDLQNVHFSKSGLGTVGHFTILNYTSDMEKGEYYRLWQYLYYEKVTHKNWINNN